MAIEIRTLKTSDWFQPDGVPLAVARRDPQEPFGLHAHEFAEIVLITGGHGLHITGTESWPLSAGDVFVIGGSRPHDYQNMENLCLINILFQPEKLLLEMADLATLPGYHALFTLEPAWRARHQFKSRLHLAPAELEVVSGFVDELDKELAARPPGHGFFATVAFMQIIGYLSRCYSHTPNPDSRSLLRIGEAISHLEKHYNKAIHLDELAGIAHMSKRSFIRAFQSALGISPITLEPAWRARHQFKSRLHLAPAELEVVSGFVDELDKELAARPPGHGFFATVAFMQIIGYLSRCYSHTPNPDSRSLLRIGEAISHLEKHYNKAIHLDELAGIAHMSKRSFIRAFQSALGISPIAYLIQLRMQRAAHLLRRDSGTITEVAFIVGFNDSNYFTRQFTRVFGIPPREHRRRYHRGKHDAKPAPLGS